VVWPGLAGGTEATGLGSLFLTDVGSTWPRLRPLGWPMQEAGPDLRALHCAKNSRVDQCLPNARCSDAPLGRLFVVAVVAVVVIPERITGGPGHGPCRRQENRPRSPELVVVSPGFPVVDTRASG